MSEWAFNVLKVSLVIAEHGAVDATAVYLSRRVQFDIRGWSIFVLCSESVRDMEFCDPC